MTDADRIRAKLATLGLSQRGAARLLGIDEREMRRYCAGQAYVPDIVWYALDSPSLANVAYQLKKDATQ